MDKQTVITAHRAHLMQVLSELERGQAAAREGMRVDGAHRPSNRGERGAVTAQGYLTAGIQARVGEVRAALQLVNQLTGRPRDRVVTGALFSAESESGVLWTCMVLPGAGGETVDGVRLISPESPIARGLWGLEAEDEGEVTMRGVQETWTVVEIA
jgi:hypothetical protein